MGDNNNTSRKNSNISIPKTIYDDNNITLSKISSSKSILSAAKLNKNKTIPKQINLNQTKTRNSLPVRVGVRVTHDVEAPCSGFDGPFPDFYWDLPCSTLGGQDLHPRQVP